MEAAEVPTGVIQDFTARMMQFIQAVPAGDILNIVLGPLEGVSAFRHGQDGNTVKTCDCVTILGMARG
jgi:hypothetical protein